ncbi:hypothetical protein [Vibrio ichthyoenteri]|uniref:hypothetical protein n=1 Tax=Vibrio ichthyoenteri TaxID=142461 RepID=UPI001110F3A5|nr:hypothetical protein [Vibrio ichthyoenteri]
MMTLIVAILLSFSVRADVLSERLSIDHLSAQVSDSDYISDEISDRFLTGEPGCCDPGGSCRDTQCCSHGSTCGSCLVGNLLSSYAAPYRSLVDIPRINFYLSADQHSLYRPPIV